MLLPKIQTLRALVFSLVLISANSPLHSQAPLRSGTVADAATPRIGILLPVNPKDYKVIQDAVIETRVDTFGPFQFTVGMIDKVPVVYNIAPGDGPLVRSLAAESMFEHYNIRTVIYPGTSGAALDPDQMHVGDIVLGAKNIQTSNFFMDQDGSIATGEFDTATRKEPFRDLYADPKLLSMMACSATRTASQTTLPAWVNPSSTNTKPAIFYFGVQGTTTLWIAERGLFDKIRHTFHHMDEDGDWYSNLAASLYHVPFIEVSVIANSLTEFPNGFRGRSPAPKGEDGSDFVAQRISYRVAVDLIRQSGPDLLTGNFGNPQVSPFPKSYFDTPKDPHELLKGLDCK